MKRHESLVPLSRFHRSVLFLALVTKQNAPEVKGYPTTPEGKKEYALKFYEEKLKDHFKQEEEILIPAIIGRDEELDQVIAQVQSDHRQLVILFNQLSDNTENYVNILFQLGDLLEKHIRMEERELFQIVQKVIPADLLEVLSFE